MKDPYGLSQIPTSACRQRVRCCKPAGADAEPLPARDLDECVACGSDLLYPLSWEQGPGGMAVLLRCPTCEHEEHGVFDDETVARFDDALDRAMASIMADHRKLSTANFAAEAEAFIAALMADQILPEDF